MNIDKLKQLRKALNVSKTNIDAAWEALKISYEHYLAESLVDLTHRLEEVKDLVNQEIGELTE